MISEVGGRALEGRWFRWSWKACDKRDHTSASAGKYAWLIDALRAILSESARYRRTIPRVQKDEETLQKVLQILRLLNFHKQILAYNEFLSEKIHLKKELNKYLSGGKKFQYYQ